MMSLVLLKIPMLFSAGYFAQKATTAPNATPEKKALDKFGDTKINTRGMAVRALKRVSKFLGLAPCFCESALLFAHEFPTHPISQAILSLLAHISLPSAVSTISISLSSTFLAGWALAASGLALRLTCFRYLGRFFTFELAIQEDQHLVTTGPYAIVRHPAYTGTLAIMTGTGLMLAGPGSFVAECLGWGRTPVGLLWTGGWLALTGVFVPFLVGKARAEDKVLRKEYGAEWEAWARKTRYRLIPFVY